MIAVALGANLSSHVGPPLSTLKAVRPRLQELIIQWLSDCSESKFILNSKPNNLRWRWSSLFETKPIGGPTNQPNYLNGVVLIDGPDIKLINPNEADALDLLHRLLELEKHFGRNRVSNGMKNGPRTLDLDLLAWGELQMKHSLLTLPHPRFIERSFVIVPLASALTSNHKDSHPIISELDWHM